MNIILFVVIAIFLVAILLLEIFLLLTKNNNESIKLILENSQKYLEKEMLALKEEFPKSRDEYNREAKELRQELNSTFTNFTTILQNRLNDLNEIVNKTAKENRDELTSALTVFETRFSQNVKDFNELQKQKFDTLILRQEDLTQKTENKLEKVNDSIENRLKSIQTDNNEKLEKMRETVDEKLHKTLETRLGESFKLVSERLELVQKGLGEMQNLATGVGDLKKVLSNVKTKGVMGEYQLENLLDQLLTIEQYGKNVKTKKNSNDMVEFAVKLPNSNNESATLWLPIDAKFPTESYEIMVNAYESGNLEDLDKAKKKLEQNIKKFAQDIRSKYIDPPNTTDFAIMFLPFEGLYAEVLRIAGLFEFVQREYKIAITGPTTISAFLNSLQFGFRSLAVEKRTSEIWQLLGAVRTEFGKFSDVLEKTKIKIEQAGKEIANAGVKSRAIERKLRDVQSLPQAASSKIIGDLTFNDESDEAES